MSLESVLESVYGFSGIVMAVSLLVVSYLFKNKAVVGRIFLKKGEFRSAIYVLAAGAAFYLAGNLGHIVEVDILHEVGEILLNLSITVFALMIIHINRPYLGWRVKRVNGGGKKLGWRVDRRGEGLRT